MNTPFGRYRGLRMPFGINSAPEIWQQRMHELVEGLTGVEVIADDFLIVGLVIPLRQQRLTMIRILKPSF